MSEELRPPMPFSWIEGQEDVIWALKATEIDPRIGGVLIAGERGTGKSTAVRSFAGMMTGKYPVTVPISATEDRVVGGWDLDALVRGSGLDPQKGLIEEANQKILYVDEVNLLEDHLVNIILDVAASGVLVVQREGRHDPPISVDLRLVGTMNPEEGSLRPQLQDRFGLAAYVATEEGEARARILSRILALNNEDEKSKGFTSDEEIKRTILSARDKLGANELDAKHLRACIEASRYVKAEGVRGEMAMARTARAFAALDGGKIESQHFVRAARLALRHRRRGLTAIDGNSWSKDDDAKIKELVEKELAQA